MSEEIVISQEEIDRLYVRLLREAEAGGYHLNPDIAFAKDLIKGLLVNEKRYGYLNCPCRLASGNKNEDVYMICPCDYRDPDLDDYGSCYCALYVTGAVLKGEKKIGSIPDRRLAEKKKPLAQTAVNTGTLTSLPLPVWRCKVCGYLCARDHPPEICPICKAKRERFERFI